MGELMMDVRYGIRMLAKRPGTTALAIVALALGIGLTTTMFSIVNGVILRGLPFDHSERIVDLSTLDPTHMENGGQPVSRHDFADWRTEQTSFEALAAFETSTVNLASVGAAPERYASALVTPNLLRLLRTAPRVGRDFTDDDATPGAPAVALISDQIWTNRFHADPSIVGQTVRINNVPVTIIGIMSKGFMFPEHHDMWMPLDTTLPAKRGDGDGLEVIGRLRATTTVAVATAEMSTIARRLELRYPENKNHAVRIVSYIRRFLGIQVIAALTTMLAAVFGVLLIACANVTNLQLARAAERIREVAVRLALGASRWRIVRQLLVEGMLLAMVGAVCGVAIAAVGIALFNRGIAGTDPPFWIDIRIDATVTCFVIGLAMIAAVASSLVPALRVARQSVNEVLKDEGRASTSLRLGRFSRILVVAEMTLSFGLLVVSGLMVKSVISIGTIAYPFSMNVLVAHASPQAQQYADGNDLRQLSERLRARVAAIPGVVSAAVADDAPGGGARTPFAIEGHTLALDEPRPIARRIAVSPEYFNVLKVSAVRGRLIAAEDRDGVAPVAIVGQDFVRKFYRDGDPIGRRIQIGADAKAPWVTIVGIVPPLAVVLQPDQIPETVYIPIAQSPERDLLVLAATSGAPTAMANAVRSAVMDIDPNLPLFQVNSLGGSYEQRTWSYRVFGGLFMTFGFGALVLAAAGLYGVMSVAVRRRTQEIGVRMALGAGRSRILGMIVRQGLTQVGIGVVLGLGLGGWLANQLRLLLYHVAPWDPAVFGITIGVLATTGVMATLVPAIRAASVEPLVALRRD